MAAVTLTYNQPGYVDRHGVGAGALDKTLDEFRMRQNEVVTQGGRFYRVETAKQGVYKEQSYGQKLELPRISEDSDKMPFATSIPGFTEAVTIINYRLAIQVERSMVEDEKMPVARNMIGGVLSSFRRLEEYAMVDRWNNLASTAAGYVGADGVAVASASHPHERRETGIWSNIETAGALTSASFSTARKNMRKRKDEFNYVDMVFPRVLVVGADLEEKALILKRATKIPESTINSPWVFGNDSWDVFVYDYLTSTTQWSLWGNRPQDSWGFIIARVNPTTLIPLEGAERSTDVMWGQRGRLRMGTGANKFDNLQHNTG